MLQSHRSSLSRSYLHGHWKSPLRSAHLESGLHYKSLMDRSLYSSVVLMCSATQNVLIYTQTHREIEVLADTSYCFNVYALAIIPLMKWVYDKTTRKTHRQCFCENPCTSSKCGRMVYIYPEKNLRAYPGAIRGTIFSSFDLRHFLILSLQLLFAGKY